MSNDSRTKDQILRLAMHMRGAANDLKQAMKIVSSWGEDGTGNLDDVGLVLNAYGELIADLIDNAEFSESVAMGRDGEVAE